MDEIDRILGSREFAQLIGREEGLHLEVKSEVHDLTSEHGRFELAKDVSAFANSSGGHILFGLITERRENSQIEVITQVALLAPSSFPETSIRGIIDTYVSPAIQGITVDLMVPAEGTNGIGVIRVPSQIADRKPFFVLRVFEGSAVLKQAVVGYYERIGDANEPMTAQRLQTAFRKGIDGVSQRLTRIEEKIETLIESSRVTPVTTMTTVDRDVRDQRLREIIEES